MQGIRSHHERLDGKGYPNGLQGDDISLDIRSLSVADVFDALSSTRSYRAAMSLDRALEILRNDEGAFDPRVVHALIALIALIDRGEIKLEWGIAVTRAA